MPGQDVLSVNSGPGVLYWDEIDGGEAVFPADPTVVPAAGWNAGPYMEDGWLFEVAQTLVDINVDEEPDPVAVEKTGQLITMTGSMAQSELELFRLAMGGGTIANTPGPPDFDTYTPPGSVDAPIEWEVLFRADASPKGTDLKLDIQLPRVISAATINLNFKKSTSSSDKRQIGVQFRALVPSAGDIFSILNTNSLT